MLNPGFKEFVALLNAHGVEYLVVGGYAALHVGASRVAGPRDALEARVPFRRDG